MPLLSSESVAETDAPFGATIDPARFRDLTAIVVDDVEDNRTVLSNLLKRHSMSVLEASNGFELLELLENHEPDVVFLDIRMPEMDGHAALQEAKTRWPDRKTLFVAVTATGIATTRATYIRYGFHDLIKKPFHFNEIAIFLSGLHDAIENEPDATIAEGPQTVSLRASHADQRASDAPSTDLGICHIPEPFRQQLVDAAEMGRVIQLRRVLGDLGDELSDPESQLVLNLAGASVDSIEEEIRYVKTLADSYDLERMVTYLTD